MVIAQLHEIFSSRQGEGPYTGEWMTFIRFQGCGLRCAWCDTPAALTREIVDVRVEMPPRSTHFARREASISPASLTTIVASYPDRIIALTGGEPLEQVAFLRAWLPTVYGLRTVLLETAGVLTRAFASLVPWIDIVSMDLKLPSSTGMKAYWSEHEAFLRAALQAKKEIYLKMVVTGQTTPEDLERAVHLVQSCEASVPLYLQPASPTATFTDGPTAHQLASFEACCRTLGQPVTVQGQMHKVWGIL